MNAWNLALSNLTSTYVPPPPEEPETKVCPACGETKPLTSFWGNGHGTYRAKCGACVEAGRALFTGKRKCHECGMDFDPPTYNAVVCGDECAKARGKRLKSERNRKYRLHPC